MSQKSKRICKCCGKQYEYCPHCGKHSDELWRNITDTEECREVLNIVSAYNMKLANKDQVKKVLDKFGVTDYGKYKDSISSVLNELFGKKQEDVQEKAAEVVESTAPVAEVKKERSIEAEPEVPAVEVRYTPAPVVDQPLATAEVEVPTMPKEEAPKEDRNSYKRRKRRRYNMDVDSQ